MSSHICRAFLAVLALQLFCSDAVAQDEPTANSAVVELDAAGFPKEGAPAFTQEQVETWRDEVLPHVEAYAGKSFTGVPKIDVVDRSAMFEAWERDFRAEMGVDRDSDEADTAVMLAMIDRMARIPYLFARYSHADGVVQVAAGNTTPLLTIMHLEREPLAEIMKLVIAHELAHALHLQHVDLKDIGSVRSEDERKALDATLEGFAMLVQAGAADRLNLSALNQRFMKASTLDEAKMQSANAFGRRYNEIYMAGLRFFQHHLAQHDMEHVWSILAEPPRTYAHITQPERYGETVATEVDVDVLFAGLEEQFSDEGMSRQALEVDSEAVAKSFNQRGKERVEWVGHVVKSAYICVFGEQGRIHSATCIELGNEEDAQAMLGEYGLLMGLQFARISGAAKESEEVSTRIDSITGDVPGIVRELTVHHAQTQELLTKLHMVVMRQDRWVVQMFTMNSDVTDERLQHISTLLLARLATGEAAKPVPGVDDTNPLVTALKSIRPALPDAEWEETIRPQPRGALEKMCGDDIKAHFAIELSFQDSQTMMLEAKSDPRASRRMVMVFIARFADADAAKAVADAIGANLAAPLERLPTAEKPTNSDIESIELDSGAPCKWLAASLIVMNQPVRLAVAVTQHDSYVIHINSSNGAVTRESLDAVVARIVCSIE